MIQFDKYELANGLKVILIPDDSTPFVVVNVTYNVGARDEDPIRTGFAHLFEHLMFGGSKHAHEFDKPLEKAGATNNAFTSNDVTNYYNVIPRENLETALWLESDRMAFLNINEKSLEVQRKVVIEEFKERYLNKPYGKAWHHLREMVFTKHPYKWPTIGKTIEHIEGASLEDVKAFYQKFYHPNNAILTLSGNIKIEDKALIEKWFGDLKPGEKYSRRLPQEPQQVEARRKEVESDVPIDMIYMAFPMPGRGQHGYYVCDLISDLLSSGESARLNQKLIKEDTIFSEINAYILGSFDPGVFVVSGKPNHGISREKAEEAVWNQLNILIAEPPSIEELQKVKNKLEANYIYQLMEPVYKAFNVAFHELMGEAEMANQELANYQSVSINDISRTAKSLFRQTNSNTLWYLSKK